MSKQIISRKLPFLSNQPISSELGQQMIDAIKVLRSLENRAVVTQEDEAKRTGATEFLVRVCFEHSDQLIASWVAVRNEYEPFLTALTGVINRINLFKAAAVAAQAQAQAKVQQPTSDTLEEESKIIPLKP